MPPSARITGVWTSHGAAIKKEVTDLLTCKTPRTAGVRHVGYRSGSVLSAEPCFCSAFSRVLKPWILEIALEYLPLFQRKYLMMLWDNEERQVDLEMESLHLPGGIHVGLVSCSWITLSN